MGARFEALKHWLAEQPIEALQLSWDIRMISGDASFRRYFRVDNGDACYVAVDSPPDKEDNLPFVCIAKSWRRRGIRVPQILAQNLQHGFLLLEDFGDRLLESELREQTADEYYRLAMDGLLQIQALSPDKDCPLPAYDQAKFESELALFPLWCLQALLGWQISDAEQQIWSQTQHLLIGNAHAQPQVSVHRDYHCRNLMLLDDGQLGVIDFQDAVVGPITYDLVSLLRDCYIDWPAEKLREWLDYYRVQATQLGCLPVVDADLFERWFDFMGLQRHLKVLGIFARLAIRDHKPNYLQYYPRICRYIGSVVQKYSELNDFSFWFQQQLHPRLAKLDSAQFERNR